MIRLVMLMICLQWVGLAGAEVVADKGSETQTLQRPAPPEEDSRWWKQREKRSEVYYPHNVHMEVMAQEGDSCLLCHSFNKTGLTHPDTLKKITVIANEALKPICHSCHVEEMRGPWRCELCHDDKEKIWPADHRHDYVNHHNEIARQDEKWCQTCHLDRNYCTDCHLRRDTAGTGYHPLAYRTLHGLESRLDSGRCGRCHNELYCSDCHATR